MSIEREAFCRVLAASQAASAAWEAWRVAYFEHAQAVAALAADVAVNALTVDWLRTRLAMEQRVLDERRTVAAALEATITGKREA